jgi:hypothetical protein
MNKFKYEIAIPGDKQSEAERKMKAIVKMIPKLSAEEWERIAEVVSNPVQLALIKVKLGI